MEALGLLRVRAKFDDPPAEYRSPPFWAWNDRPQEEELVRQIREMKEQGMGGFFIHSRDGLETEYMGPEWMRLVRSAVEAAEAHGLQAWLYDEDRWPSGFAGGLVQARGGDAFRAKGLTLEVLPPDGVPTPGACEALFKAVIRDRELFRCERLPIHAGPVPLKADEVLLVFRVEVSERSAWFNNEAPPDHLNPETVRAFIDITYEAYKREVGEHFGRIVRGVFSDESSVHDRHCRFTEGRGWIPWSGSFPDFFRERRGYDLLDFVPYLYFNGELSPQTRHDYWRTITERFSESYSGQLGEWCGKNGIAFTGHYLWENNLGTATRVCGAVMPNYRYQQVPGIDLLGEQTNEYITVKQCSSVANQYGRKFVLSETYGCTGWAFTFEGQRWLGDFQYALGVNLRSQHLALYSIKGRRKRDYPPVFNYNTSWWKYNHVTEDYFARLGGRSDGGKSGPGRAGPAPVLHRVEHGRHRTVRLSRPREGPGRLRHQQLRPRVQRVPRPVLRAHYDFDLGDETIMAETGEVRGGKLAVNLAEYRVVVLPAIRTMLGSTLRLLRDFLEAGGKAVAVGPCPAMLEGRPSEQPQELYAHPNLTIVQDAGEAAAALERILPRRVSITSGQPREEAQAFLYMLRDAGDCRILFVVNNDREQARRVEIAVEGSGGCGGMERADGRGERGSGPDRGRICPLRGRVRSGGFQAVHRG
ncbi:hypothetical protein LJK88_17145 [Paenibacillus sp. P26]|nr:hypothetical protein LJK88_17145 [Paenibacillus sp. P26]